jgi:hypothetical protein
VLTALIENSGYADAPPSELRFTRETTAGEVVLELPVPAIPAQQNTVISGNWDIQDALAGRYTIIANIDAPNDIHEQNETNNDAFTVVPIAADLALSQLAVQQISATNLRVTIENQGIRPVTAWDLWLVPGTEFVTPTTPLWASTLERELQPGQRTNLFIELDTPLPTTYHIRLDPQDTVFEIAEWNNVLAMNTQVSPAGEASVYLPLIQR